MNYVYKEIASPVGKLKLVASGNELVAVLWENDAPARVPLMGRGAWAESLDDPILRETELELAEYFAGERTRFSVRVSFEGTPFQKDVWAALREIPFGETRSYAEIAQRVGRPAAVRAVGAANGRNPISIIAPCHRVVGSNGKLTGFAGGLEVKAYLLDLESKERSGGKKFFKNAR